MRYTIKNSKNGIVSAVDVQGTLRIYLPAEMADHLALQLADQDAQSGTTRVCTPEIVLGELIYDENGNYRTYDNQTVDTSSFEDYYDNKTEGGHGQSVADEAMLVNGTLSTGSASRTLTAQSEGAGEEETDVIRYDYQILDDLVWLLHGVGLRLVRAER